MPQLNSFIPAYHSALIKVRCNPPANLSAGVEQAIREYLSIHESKSGQRVRFDYDAKLDEREKLFPAPRQRFNWKGYVHSYFYNPGLYTIDVANATEIMEMFRSVPESTIDPETTDTAGAPGGEQKGLNKLLLKELMQLNNRKEAEQKEVLPDAHGVKRKLEEEVQNVSAKCSRMTTSSAEEAEKGQGRQKYAENVLIL